MFPKKANRRAGFDNKDELVVKDKKVGARRKGVSTNERGL
jgi:hypothetical protein